jgi:hypothetical protein
MGKIYEPNLKDILSILNLKDFERTNHVISYDVQAKKYHQQQILFPRIILFHS